MIFVVIDDDSTQTRRLAEWLQTAFPSSTVMPEKMDGDRQVFHSWASAHDYLSSFPEHDVIVCLDLALLQKDYVDALRGLGEGRAIRERRPNWTLIAFTQFGKRVEGEAQYKEYFDGMIEKAEFDSCTNKESCLEFIKRQVGVVLSKRSAKTGAGVLAGVRVVDSLGMRLFQAAFPLESVAEILRFEAEDWQRPEIECLTSGHSGAFMLSIRGERNGEHSLILKVARSNEIIRAEMQAQQRYLSQLGPLSGHLVQLDSDARQLLGGVGVYYRQARIIGEPLLNHLTSGRWKKQRGILAQVTSLCLKVCDSADLEGGMRVRIGERFPLTDIDLGRLEASIGFLTELGKSLNEKDYWPIDISPEKVCSGVQELARGWRTATWTNVEIPAVVQHGDLNPGNVMITETGPVLIDLQRLGPWPVGYDVSRLALILRLRLMDADGHRDWLPDALRQWQQEPVAELNVDASPDEALCSAAMYCDQQFAKFLRGTKGLTAKLVWGYRIGTLWDLLKTASYTDLSPFKRLWAVMEAFRLYRVVESELGGIES